ncbi:hypothetical protein PAPYR_10657 [Paratrimastix pyriformis]|uniref:Uncharacterized protein n=1 Tax=Paratrimastix pyriformis TaxID=342808 RepID=A0ABQ8UCL9_9EUKA|nr:hypothetical protein PAPYR_10657 [Paratrimastix pyriformis]
MGDVVYPGPPDYLCSLSLPLSRPPRTSLGVGSTGVDTEAGERVALEAGAVPLVNFHPFRGADYRWAGTVASSLEISITVFDGGTLCLACRHGPWGFR